MKYDLHIHSKYSPCSNLDPATILKRAQKAGLDGIAITDHNEIEGALKVASLNKNKDFDVIIGSEIRATDGGDVLAYYLNEKVKSGTFEEIIDQLREQGCIIALAHPLDILRSSFSRAQVSNPKVVALETFNGRVLVPVFNTKARQLSKRLNKAQIGGSDAHFDFEIGSAYTEFSGTLRQAIRKKKTVPTGSTIRASIGYFRTSVHRVTGKLYTSNSRE